jgi:NADH:ubiquinone oxidoreductase subunit 3 (subunit A)
LASTPAYVQTAAGIEPAYDLSAYYPVFMLLIVSLGIAFGALIASHILGPRKNTAVKLMPYESGMDPIGTARLKFDVKYYLIAILFLVFDVELLFLYPWAVIAYREDGNLVWRSQFGRFVFWEIIVFLSTLLIAYVYAWRKGVFKWR